MNEKLKLFHISRDFNETIKVFEPRIPHFTMGREDTVTPRICVAPTIEGCVQAHPSVLVFLNPYELSLVDYLLDEKRNEQVYLLSHGTSGILCKLYTFEVDKSKVKTDTELLASKLVPDVNNTNEHWIVESMSPTKVEYVLIQKAEVETCYETDRIIREDIQFKVYSEEDLGIPMNLYHYYLHQDFIETLFPNQDISTVKFSGSDIKQFDMYFEEQQNRFRQHSINTNSSYSEELAF